MTLVYLKHIGTIGHVEQQIQEVQPVQQQQHIQSSQHEDEAVKDTKKKPRQFPGKQHIHLILPDEQANMIKELAKYSGQSVNTFMSKAINTLYEDRWKEVYTIIQQMQHKMGMDQKPSKGLF